MKKIYLVLFVILCTIVFSCTDNLISTDLDSHKNSVTSELRVFVKQSRLIGPELSDVSWDVKLRKGNENDTISGKNINGYYLFSGLESGTYSISVSGKIDNIEKFTGSAKVILEDGKNLDVNVPVVAQKGTAEVVGTGYATITMDMSEELLSKIVKVFFQAKLVGADDKVCIASFVDEENQILLDNQQITFAYTDYNHQTTDIPAGYYNLSFVGLEDFGYSIKLKDNLVEIGDGLTTNIVLTENDYEIVENYYSVLYVNKDGGENADGKTLSNPIAFSSLNDDNFSDAEVLYLLSDVEFTEDANSEVQPSLSRFYGTISSFDSTVRTISSPEGTTGQLPSCTLKNIKLSGIFSNIENNLYITIEDTVILDCKMASNRPIVYLSKSSNLVVGKNFSGDLYVSLVGEWNLGDTVINFENGKPENSNFYIEEYCCNSQEQYYSAMFYIDDSGKLAKYTDDFTSFAWTGNTPHLVTKTQAKNNTYTSIFFNGSNNQLNFTGISTYDEENQTWYFISREDSSLIPYSVTLTDKYTNSVEAEPVFASIGQFDIQAMSYDAGKLYFGSKESDFNLHFMEDEQLKSCSIQITSQDYYIGDLTSLLVKGNEVYFATTVTSKDQTNKPTTHSAIWKYELTEDDSSGGYTLSLEGEAPYYLTHSDIELTVNGSGSLPEGSTFRITDLYSDGTSVYGLLANYIETTENNANGNIYMRGSVFKLVENTTTVNAIHYGLRNSLSISDISTAKQSFILPRKIVGIVNKKLIIADDGMILDKTDCNLDRFILFDLDGTLSEIIDVNVHFTTSGTSSRFATGPLF